MSDTINPVTHVFDQTNGVIDGLEGESDGTAGSEAQSAADRDPDAVVPAEREPDSSPVDADATTAGTRADHSGPQVAEVDVAETTASTESAGETVATEPVDTDPDPVEADADPVDADPVHADTVDTDPVDTDPVDTDPVDTDPVDTDTAATGSGVSALADDSIGHVFDQTNGVIEGLDGDSDGTVDGDERSAADRGGLNEPNPVGQQDAFREDHYSADDGRDRNP